MDTLPPPHLFSDPNARLLASVFPKPPASLGVRAARALASVSQRGSRRVGALLRSASESLPHVLACGGLGLALGAWWGAPARAEPAVVTAVLAALREARVESPTPLRSDHGNETPTSVSAAGPAAPCATSAGALAANEEVATPNDAEADVGAGQEPAAPARAITERDLMAGKRAVGKRAVGKRAIGKRAIGKNANKRAATGSSPRPREKATRAPSAAKRASAGSRARPRAAYDSGLRRVIASK